MSAFYLKKVDDSYVNRMKLSEKGSSLDKFISRNKLVKDKKEKVDINQIFHIKMDDSSDNENNPIFFLDSTTYSFPKFEYLVMRVYDILRDIEKFFINIEVDLINMKKKLDEKNLKMSKLILHIPSCGYRFANVVKDLKYKRSVSPMKLTYSAFEEDRTITNIIKETTLATTKIDNQMTLGSKYEQKYIEEKQNLLHKFMIKVRL